MLHNWSIYQLSTHAVTGAGGEPRKVGTRGNEVRHQPGEGGEGARTLHASQALRPSLNLAGHFVTGFSLKPGLSGGVARCQSLPGRNKQLAVQA